MSDIPWIPLTKENYAFLINNPDERDTAYSCIHPKTGKTFIESTSYCSMDGKLNNYEYMAWDSYEYNPELGYWVNNESGAYIVAYCVLTPFKFELER